MGDIAHPAGLIAAKLLNDPSAHCHILTTTTHKTLRGPRSGFILSTKELAKKIDKAVFPGIQGGPLMHIIAAKAVAFKRAMTDEFKEYAKQVVKNAKALAEELLRLGYKLVTGGTDSHMILVDLRPLGITGKDAEKALERAGITVNKNAVPNDPLPPTKTSGIRIGTPAITSRGMKEEEMRKIAQWIDRVIKNLDNEEEIKKVRKEVMELCEQFPLYAELRKKAKSLLSD